MKDRDEEGRFVKILFRDFGFRKKNAHNIQLIYEKHWLDHYGTPYIVSLDHTKTHWVESFISFFVAIGAVGLMVYGVYNIGKWIVGLI